MSRYPQIQPFLLLIPLLLLFLIQDTVAEAEAEPVIISGATNWVSSAPQKQADGSAPRSKGGWWTVDRSPATTAPKDAWWTGCNNRTSDEQRNASVAHIVNTQACLDWYYWGGLKDQWSGTLCNGVGFFRGTADDYKDSAACYEKCYGCLTQSIQAGSINAICRDGHGKGVGDVLRGEAEVPDK
ncbi:MAG: hypothetical protein LQ337_003070 [Flavoplaca oasis]|nr:MAG: hypothetical protein LQ337_003070 [Flavoplaca oasis]